MTLSTGGFRQVVAFPPAPIATGWSDPCREGLAPSQELCLSTAHDFTTTTPELKFSVHTAREARSTSDHLPPEAAPAESSGRSLEAGEAPAGPAMRLA